MHEDLPLVSVIVRSVGRASLAATIGSIARQSYRPVEIVIVNAGASRLPPLPALPRIDSRVIEGGPYNRPRAANAGLAAARGDWIVFLDDDDAFLPDHIESLLRRVRASDGALLAYSATQCLDSDGRTAMTIEVEFDRLKLFSLNYIQIGAALFSRTLVEDGCRFDDELECLQDWDFWLQLAQRTHFVHTGKATNQWSAFSGGSGCGMGSNSNPPQFDRFRKILIRKWRSIGEALRRKVDHHNRLAGEAMRGGLPDRADAHMIIAERLLRGPAQSPCKRATITRREAATRGERKVTTTAGA